MWNGIFIRYTDTTKHVRVWALRTHQVLITSKPIPNKSNRGSQLFIEHLILPSERPFQEQVSESKPRGKSRKNVVGTKPMIQISIVPHTNIAEKRPMIQAFVTPDC